MPWLSDMSPHKLHTWTVPGRSSIHHDHSIAHMTGSIAATAAATENTYTNPDRHYDHDPRESCDWKKCCPNPKEIVCLEHEQHGTGEYGWQNHHHGENVLALKMTAQIHENHYGSDKQWRKDNELLFPSKFCGTASEDICMKGYRFVIRLGNQLPKTCKVPSSQSLSKELRLPYWEVAFQEKAFRVWSEICRNSH